MCQVFCAERYLVVTCPQKDTKFACGEPERPVGAEKESANSLPSALDQCHVRRSRDCLRLLLSAHACHKWLDRGGQRLL